jgi:hypothetical protein
MLGIAPRGDRVLWGNGERRFMLIRTGMRFWREIGGHAGTGVRANVRKI